MTLRAWDAVTGRLVELSDDPASADHLPPGSLDDARYLCESCRKPLSLSRRRGPTSAYRPRFAHGQRDSSGLDVCGARADIRQNVAADIEVVIDLRDRLTKAWPGTTTLIECPQPPTNGQPAPPVIVAHDGDQVLIIECPHGDLSDDLVRRRIRAVRDRYGPAAAHVWFFAEDPRHFRQGELKDKWVRPHGADKSVRHMRIRPTDRQLQIVEAGGAVYWVNGNNVLVPYGGHDFMHDPRSSEDWTGEVARYRYDWRISHPVPAPGAQWWGLVPIGLSSLRGGRVAFHPADAHDVMERLERSQSARWNASRRRAREQYQNLHRPTPPPPVATEPAPPRPEPTRLASEPVPAAPESLPPRPSEPPAVPPPPRQPPRAAAPGVPAPRRRRRSLTERLRDAYRRRR
ncbi:hypothetical protein [Streptomyces sp. NPDC001205]